MYDAFLIKRYQLIELLIPAGLLGLQSQVYFQQQPQIQTISGDKTVIADGIESISDDSFAMSPFTSGQPVANAAAIANASLSLSVANDFRYLNVPLASMSRLFNAASATSFNSHWFRFWKTQRIDWTKSFVTLSNVPVGAPFSYLFGVAYHFEDDQL